MSTLQKITAEARKIRRVHKKMKWTDAIKKASARLKREGKLKSSSKKSAPRRNTASAKFYQTGTSNKLRDRMRPAKLPGKRLSKSGRTYYEHRKNRSDMQGSLTGVGEAKLMSELRKKVCSDLGTAYVLRDMAKTKKMKNAYTKKISALKQKLRKLS